MVTVAWQNRFQDHPTFGFVDWVLRGIGQVVFQNNPISGAVILAGIFYNSWIYGTVCLAWNHHQYSDRPFVESRQGDDQGWALRIQRGTDRNRTSCLYEPELHNRKHSQSTPLPLHCALCGFHHGNLAGLRRHTGPAQGTRSHHALCVGHLVRPRRVVAVFDH